MKPPAGAMVLYACRARHHEHCAEVVSRVRCGCPCHWPQHRAWLERRRAERKSGPATDAAIMQQQRDWVAEQEGAERERLEALAARGPAPSDAPHPIDEETVEAIDAICALVDVRWAPWWEVQRARLGDIEVLGPALWIGSDGTARPVSTWKRRYWDRKASGRCVDCGRRRELEEDRVYCGPCAEKDLERSRRRRERWQQPAAGVETRPPGAAAGGPAADDGGVVIGGH